MISGADGLPLHAGVAGHILHGEQAAQALDLVHDGLGDAPLVELVDAALRDLAQGIRIVGVGEVVPHRIGQAFVGKYLGRLLVLHQFVEAGRGPLLKADVDIEALLRQLDDRGQHLLPGHGAILLQGGQGTVDLSRDGDQHGPLLLIDLVQSVDARRRRSGLHGLDTDVLARLLQIDGHEAGAAQAGGTRLGEAVGKDHGHRGVHRVAPRLQDIHADAGGVLIGADHRCLIAYRGVAVGICGQLGQGGLFRRLRALAGRRGRAAGLRRTALAPAGAASGEQSRQQG